MSHLIILRIAISVLLPIHAAAQSLDEATCKEMHLRDGVEVKVCATADNKNSFYYLPHTLQLCVSNGTPQISLMVYKEKANDKIAGGILHLLYQWGLTREQEEELQQLLLGIDSTAVLMGPADITFDNNTDLKFEPEEELIAAILNASLSQALKIPSTASGKSAVSFQLSGGNASALWNYLTNPALVKGAALVAGYHYSIAEYQGVVRSTIEKQATVTGLIKTWMQQAKMYNNAKTVNQ
jgi:hypothetical protein